MASGARLTDDGRSGSLSPIRLEIPDETLERWQQVVDLLADVLQVPAAIITRVELPEGEVMRASNSEGNPYKKGMRATMNGHYCEAVIRDRDRLQVVHAPSDERWNHAPELKYGMVAYLGYPVYWPGGEVFGTICVLDNRHNAFGRRYDAMLQEFRYVLESQLALLALVGELERKNRQLEQSFAEIKVLRGILPVCGFCRRVRDDAGYWRELEEYVAAHSDTAFSHGLCPACMRAHYPDLADEDPSYPP
ncbi:MAG: GAF domain-containing protein [Myxococcota bacterium]